MGRPTFLEQYNLSTDDLIELYNDCMHIDQLAEDLEVSKKTLTKHLKNAGITHLKHRKRKRYKRHSKLAEWVRRHPTETLPSSVPMIQRKTGLSRFTIHHYLYRRREDYYRYVKKHWVKFLKKHRRKKTLEFDTMIIPILAIKKEMLTIDKFSLKITVIFLFKDGTKRKIAFSKEYFDTTVEARKKEA